MMSKNKKEFVVYKITNITNGMCYIGITTNYKKRMRGHFNYNYDDTYLHNTIKKYGKSKFISEIIFECNSWEELCKKEIIYIKQFNTKRPNGYNLTDGGEGQLGVIVSKETRLKMSESHKGENNPFYKQKHTPESCKKISDALQGEKHPNYGKHLSKITKRKISKANKGKIISEETRKKISEAGKGKKHTAEARKKISESHKGKKKSKEHCKKISEAKLIFTNKQILEIRKMLLDKIPQRKIAKKFGVAHSTIGIIKRNERYAEIRL